MLIKRTKTALAFVDEIAGDIAKDNPTRATRFVLELQAAVSKLQAHPGWAGLAVPRHARLETISGSLRAWEIPH